MIDLEVPGPKAKNQKQLRTEVHRCLRMHASDISILQREDLFPGCQPVSLARCHLEELHTCVVCEKSDGVRYFLYVPQSKDARAGPLDEVIPTNGYLVDRRYDFWEIKVLLMRGHVAKGCCLLDGELVVDNDTEVRFLVYDALLCNGDCFMNNPYLDRLRAALHLVIPVRLRQLRSQACIPLFVKDFFDFSSLNTVVTAVIPKLPHKNDGLIFTQKQLPYILGTSATILKWKPDYQNTVDFALKEEPQGTIRLFTSSRDVFEAYQGELGLTPEEAESTLQTIRNMSTPPIVECFYHHDTQKWKIVKVRTDKDKANNTKVVENIWISIQERITLEQLMALAESTGADPVKRPRYQ